MSTAKWNDISIYSRGDKRPKDGVSHDLFIGPVRLIVTRHVYYPPDVWVCDCDQLNVNCQLNEKRLAGAKLEALAIIRRIVDGMAVVLENMRGDA